MKDDDVILLVEDEGDYATLVKEALVSAGIVNPVYVVQNGEDAVAYLSGTGKFADHYNYPFPSLIILDLHMAGMGGVSVLRWLTAHSRLKQDLKYVVLSAVTSPQEIDAAGELGAEAYFMKSPDNTELGDLVDYLKKARVVEPKR